MNGIYSKRSEQPREFELTTIVNYREEESESDEVSDRSEKQREEKEKRTEISGR